jgi:putative transposase
VAENVLNRKFTADAPNEKWVTDETEFKYGNGQKAYLSAILDLHDKSIHSDRGYQYTSLGFKKILDDNEMTQSMSRVGRCIDNGPMEFRTKAA